MKKRALVLLSVALSLLIVPSLVFAHHSDAAYDKEHLTTLRGTVTEFKFSNPHVAIVFEVNDGNGVVEKWTAFFGAPNSMRRELGWNGSTIQSGQQITIGAHRARDGRQILGLIEKLMLDGKDLPIRDIKDLLKSKTQ